MFLRYGDDSSADDKDEEVKEPDHKTDSLQSLVENTRFSLTSLNSLLIRVRVYYIFFFC